LDYPNLAASLPVFCDNNIPAKRSDAQEPKRLRVIGSIFGRIGSGVLIVSVSSPVGLYESLPVSLTESPFIEYSNDLELDPHHIVSNIMPTHFMYNLHIEHPSPLCPAHVIPNSCISWPKSPHHISPQNFWAREHTLKINGYDCGI
jgi:hypothetical protein